MEGLDYTLAILDEAGVANRDSYEVLTLAQGKRETVDADGDRHARTGPEQPSAGRPAERMPLSIPTTRRWCGASSPLPVSRTTRLTAQHCWELANPALDDFLHRDAMHALLPPKTREATFRRARLCQFATDTDGAFLPAGCGTGCRRAGRSRTAPRSSSRSTVRSRTTRPRCWPGPSRLSRISTRSGVAATRTATTRTGCPSPRWSTTIRDACRRWRVVEIVADPFRWTRTLQALEAERLPVVEFPHSPARLTAATTDLYSAAVNGRMSHSRRRDSAAHVAAAVIVEDAARHAPVQGIAVTHRTKDRPGRLPGHGP